MKNIWVLFSFLQNENIPFFLYFWKSLGRISIMYYMFGTIHQKKPSGPGFSLWEGFSLQIQFLW
jgi:hypothetical protein